MAETTSLQQSVDMVGLALLVLDIRICINFFHWHSILFINMMIRENVTVAAHENHQKYSMLDDLDRDKSIQDTWKNTFVKNRLGSERDLKERMIGIRFIIQRDLVVRHFYLTTTVI